MNTVYLNGQYLPLEEASISVMDRGFLFGDGIYEVIPCYAGQLFRFEQHIERLNRSLRAIDLRLDYSLDEWRNTLLTLTQRNHVTQCSVYLQVTRGVYQTRDHRWPEQITPTVFARLSPLPESSQRPSSQGIKLKTVEDIRWKRCDIKAITLLANCIARQEAEKHHADEALFVNDGYAIEGSASNVFIVSNGVLKTAPKSEKILGGITRDLVLEIARENQIPCDETLFTLSELKQAEEVWVTSSTREIQPVWWVDEFAVNQAKTGKVWFSMIEHYMAFKEKLYRGEIK